MFKKCRACGKLFWLSKFHKELFNEDLCMSCIDMLFKYGDALPRTKRGKLLKEYMENHVRC